MSVCPLETYACTFALSFATHPNALQKFPIATDLIQSLSPGSRLDYSCELLYVCEVVQGFK